MSSYSITQVELKVKRTLTTETLALADDVLAKHNKAWGEYLVTGDHRAYWDALALWQDREVLLAEVGR